MGTHKKCKKCGKDIHMNDRGAPPETCPFCKCAEPTK